MPQQGGLRLGEETEAETSSLPDLSTRPVGRVGSNNDNSQLERKVAFLQKCLKAEQEAYDTQIQQLTAKLSSVERSLRSANVELDVQQEEFERQDMDFRDTAGKLQESRKVFASKDQELKRKCTEIDETRTKLRKSEKQLTDKEKELEQRIKELDTERAKRKISDEKRAGLARDLENERELNRRHVISFQELTTKNKGVEGALSAETSRLDGAARTIEKLGISLRSKTIGVNAFLEAIQLSPSDSKLMFVTLEKRPLHFWACLPKDSTQALFILPHPGLCVCRSSMAHCIFAETEEDFVLNIETRDGLVSLVPGLENQDADLEWLKERIDDGRRILGLSPDMMSERPWPPFEEIDLEEYHPA